MVLIIDYKFLVLFRVSAILTEYQDLKIKNRELVDFFASCQIFDFDFLGREWTEIDKDRIIYVNATFFGVLTLLNECSRQEVWSLCTIIKMTIWYIKSQIQVV